MENVGSYLENYPEISPEYAFASKVIETLQKDGHEAYIVGGFCRDLVRGEASKDVDIATSAKPDVVKDLPIEGAQLIFIDAAEALPVVKAHKDGMEVEIATYRKDIYGPDTNGSRIPDRIDLDATVVEDAERRDLTINALYFDPLSEQLIDPTEQGFVDIENRTIRFVGDARERILQDRVRILRAVRFKNNLGFDYAPETRQALMDCAGEVEHIGGKDRIYTELLKMLSKPTRAEAIQDLDELGILEYLLPEFTAGKEVEQSDNHHSEGNVYFHQILALRNLPPQASDHLIMATLLHDIGKQFTSSTDENGTIHFYGHDEVGVEMARKILNRMRVKTEDMHCIVWLIANHMRVWQFLDMKRSTQLAMVMPHLKDPKIKREDLFDDLVTLLEVDGMSSLGPDGTPGIDREMISQIRARAEELRAESLETKPTVREQFGMDGRALIELLDITKEQQKYLSKLITHLNTEYQNNPEMRKEDVVILAKEWWEENSINKA